MARNTLNIDDTVVMASLLISKFTKFNFAIECEREFYLSVNGNSYRAITNYTKVRNNAIRE